MLKSALPFDRLCVACGLGKPEAEHRFHPLRRWRFDWAWPDRKIALEIEGGAWIGGRHTRGAGYVKDLEKYNQAVLHGWKVLRVTPKQIADGTALSLLVGLKERAEIT